MSSGIGELYIILIPTLGSVRHLIIDNIGKHETSQKIHDKEEI